jgi:DNA-binding transcriptional LysR family regulator
MNFQDLEVVLKVAEFRSITAAATSLDMRVATASAALKRVEASLGVELFIRTTRQLKLSPAGERYLPECQQALNTLENAKQAARAGLDILHDEIRIAVSSDLGRNIVTPWLDTFLSDYPEVSLHSNITDSHIDFYRDSIDMALRYGAPNDASMYGFKICNVPRLLCASKQYLAQHGTPQHPDELRKYNGLFYQLHDIVQDEWRFRRGDELFKVKLKGNRASNDGDLVRRWCVAGNGLAIKSSLDMSKDLLNGDVESLMAEFKPTPTELWLVCPSRQSITPTMRLLRDFLRDKTHSLLSQMVEKNILDNSVFD